jgi:DNA-binding protein HU-beta
MTKTELIAILAERSGVTQAKAKDVLESLIEVITEEVKDGRKVSLVGFGTFEVAQRSARSGRNPKTGEEIQIPACKAPKFKPGKAFKEAVN